MRAPNDTIDFGEIAGALRDGWRWIAGGLLFGLALGALVVLLVQPRYDSAATVLLRSGSQERGASLGSLARNAQSGMALGGLTNVLSLNSEFETEIEILASRSVVEAVVDSLGLQAEVTRPRGLSLTAVFADARWDPDLPSRVTYRFREANGTYQVTGPGVSGPVTPGVLYRAGGSTFTLRTDGLPASFQVRVIDRQRAVERTQKRLNARRAGGDLAQIRFRGTDRPLVAVVPNAIVDRYLYRRRTSDRGVNQRKLEFLQVHTDSVRLELARAERTLRAEQERSGVFEPEAFGQAELDRGLQLRSELVATDIEARAFREVLERAMAGTLSPRDLAAYPTLLHNPATNDLLARLTTLEAERTSLIERRTERDEDVLLLDRQIAQLEGQLVARSTAYLEGLSRRQAEMQRELGRYSAALAELPAHAEANYRAQRDVKLLSETLVALEAELVQARLAALAEGGDVRQVDQAIRARRPAFPKPLLTMIVGLAGGLVFGGVGAVGSFYLGRRIRKPIHAEIATGLPSLAFDGISPVLLRRSEDQRVLLLLPVGKGVSATAVAHRLAATVALQGESVVVAELERGRPGAASPDHLAESSPTVTGANVATSLANLQREEHADGGAYFVYDSRSNGAGNSGVRTAIQELAARFEVLLVALPSLHSSDTAALLANDCTAVLVARAGTTRRDELRAAVATLERLGVATAGVILRQDGGDGGPRA